VLRDSNADLLEKGQTYKELAIRSISRTLWAESTEEAELNKQRLGRTSRAGRKLRKLDPGLYVGLQDLGLSKM
jgi:hypothetical protein